MTSMNTLRSTSNFEGTCGIGCWISQITMNTRLYRLTLTEEESAQWWKTYMSVKKQPTVQTRRIYRWGTMWGILQTSKTSGSGSSGGAWIAENRLNVASSTHILDSVKRSQHLLPPPSIDDLWEEEVVQIDNTAEFNGLLSITGNLLEIQEWCRKHDLTTALAFLGSTERDQHVVRSGIRKEQNGALIECWKVQELPT